MNARVSFVSLGRVYRCTRKSIPLSTPCCFILFPLIFNRKSPTKSIDPVLRTSFQFSQTRTGDSSDVGTRASSHILEIETPECRIPIFFASRVNNGRERHRYTVVLHGAGRPKTSSTCSWADEHLHYPLNKPDPRMPRLVHPHVFYSLRSIGNE